MIQKETYLNIIDNSGVKKVACIHVYGGYRQRYAKSGEIILAAVKSIKKRKYEAIKFKKGDITKVLVVHTRVLSSSFYSNQKKHYENAGILISKTNKIIGSRIFGSLDNSFRFSKFLKIVSLSKGIYK